ncbi:MAG TPA: cupin domain-containing protein [Steroidobacteraceae bacterium]|nr:cupin domain-containing protein [Steroidobacteraceae bacterium]
MRAPSVVRLFLAASLCTLTIGASAVSYDTPNRHELKRADLSGAPGMEVITSISEYQVGESIPRHLHHGVETGYVLQGSMIQMPGQAPTRLESGSPIMNLRDVPHAGFKVVGPEPLKLLTVHVVDKDKPLYDWVK